MQLCLGTVQFGMNYGICGQKQPSVEAACEMLDYAVHNGISHIDTAKQYGTAEDVVGIFLRKKTINRDDVFISTKFQPNRLDNVAEKDYYDVFKTEMLGQLKRLGTDYIDAYLLHSARYVYDDAILNALSKLKKEGYAKLVGVSVYEPDEAIKGIEKDTVDFLQLPFSIFDQRMRNAGVFEIAKKGKNTIIDSRSAFVQGLILMNEEQVPDYLADAKPIVKKIDALCKEHRISRTALALNYVKSQEEISSLVFGVDNLEQLKENIDSFNMNVDYDLMRDISKEFENVKAEIVMPSLWVKH